MYSKSDNVETMINDKSDEAIEEFFKSLLSIYKIGLETSIKGSDFVFDCVYLLYYKYHKINPKCYGLSLESSGCIKNKKAAINPFNKNDNKCFQNAITVAFIHEKIGKLTEKISIIKPFIDKRS